MMSAVDRIIFILSITVAMLLFGLLIFTLPTPIHEFLSHHLGESRHGQESALLDIGCRLNS